MKTLTPSKIKKGRALIRRERRFRSEVEQAADLCEREGLKLAADYLRTELRVGA